MKKLTLNNTEFVATDIIADEDAKIIIGYDKFGKIKFKMMGVKFENITYKIEEAIE